MMKTLSEVIIEIREKNPEMMVVLKTEMYGMFWAGKAKFASSGYSFEAGCKQIKSIERRQNDVTITI